MNNPQHTIRLKVRDYECDLQGIVNNANYQHYLEHARHEFLLMQGVSFAELHDQGIDCVVARVTMSFKQSLRSRDEYDCQLRVAKEGCKYVFHQDILRASDGKLAVRATIDSVVVIDGKLASGLPMLDALCQMF